MYDELYDRLTTGEDALSRDQAGRAQRSAQGAVQDPQGRKRLACLPHLTSNAYAT
jgi:hypothetical protein